MFMTPAAAPIMSFSLRSSLMGQEGGSRKRQAVGHAVGGAEWSATIVDALRASRNNGVRFDIRGSFAGGAVVPGIIVTRAIRGDQGGGCLSITAPSPAYLGDAASRPPPLGNGVVDFAQHAHHHLMQLGIIRILRSSSICCQTR